MNVAALKLIVVFSGACLLFQGPAGAKDWDRGKIEYKSKCAVCHGMNAKGDGPFASQLKIAPADLTQLAKKNGGVFPQDSVEETIDGRKEDAAHGPRDMPVWGYRYNLRGEAGQKSRLDALIGYLKRIQEE